MEYIVIFLILIIFNTSMFYYMAQIFDYKCNKMAWLLQINMINLPIFMIEILIVPPQYAVISILAFLLVLFCEMKFIFRVPMLVCIFGSMCFTINLFSIRTIIICIRSLYAGKAMGELLSEPSTRILVGGMAAGISIVYVIVTMKLLTPKKMKMALKHKDNIAFSTILLVITLVYMLLMSISFTQEAKGNIIAIMNLKGAILCIICYFNSMLCVYYFSKFKGYISDFETRTKELDEKEEELDFLEEKATYDQFSGLKNRKYGNQILEQYVAQKEKFFVTFIDLDELKVANDQYGHGEGDFYIKEAAKIIREIYKLDVCARLGGDEFIVIGKMGRDAYIPLKKAVKCSENIRVLGINHRKKYDTSISYGIVVVDERNTLTGTEILKIADERMYEYKKKQKKQRVVKRV